MSIECPGLIARSNCTDVSTSRVTQGRFGYTGAPIPVAIVLHKLVNQSAASWNDQVATPLPHFLCGIPTADGCLVFPTTHNPKSAHFLVTAIGAVQYAELSATTLGLDYLLNSSWPGLTALLPIADINAPFIHVIVDGDCANSLVTLLCCIGIELERSLPIIAASDLQSDRPELFINPSTQVQVDDCVASGGFPEQASIATLTNRVETLETCCLTNTSDIVLLKSDVVQLNGKVSVLQSKVLTLEEKVIDIYQKIAVIPALVAQITTLTNQVADILTRCCPKKTETTCFRYQLLPGSEMLVTANQCIWLNLPTKVEDRDNPNCTTGCCGTIVKPGPLWVADLSCSDCNSCGTWSLSATVRFRLAQWCSGKKASIYLIACGHKYLLAEQIISTTGPQVVTLTGTFLLPCDCSDVHLLVCDSDDKIVTAHIIEFAEFRGCCA